MVRYGLMVALVAVGLLGSLGCDTSTLTSAAKMTGIGDLLQLQTQDQDRLQDGSCSKLMTQDQLRLRDGSCAKLATQDQIRLQLQDGSCQD